ncbi:hypothetical protein GA565_04775 [Rouxiella sp. S1S-2]|uniref:glycoside hydrolase family 18 protein n=1 Tax=Rouxiella sp. S1S-2 TaxID=2653856 RepID=UPI0012659DBB|nr:glycoside hydrolase family 18 protein [Rouxiella sp. S1S-2]KAB7895356.1 hypothetical protein GA565_04775 [Rouxiella sp. S1S-2]
MKKIIKLSMVAIATCSALYGANVIAARFNAQMPDGTVEITAKESGTLKPVEQGESGAVSKYRGDRPTAKLKWRSTWVDSEMAGQHPHSPINYELVNVKYKDAHDVNPESTGKLTTNGYAGNMEHNVPFNVTKNSKIVGLYVPEWSYWDQAHPAEFTPAKNLTHVFYSFIGMCDYGAERPTGTLKPSENDGLKAEGNLRGQKIIKGMCGQGPLPTENGDVSWDESAGKNSPAKQQGDFNLTKFDPQASHFMFKAMEAMKKAHPNLKVMVSVGGWTLSSPFNGMAETSASRAIFVKSVVQFLKDHPYVDGIDLDWEFVGGGGPTTHKEGLALSGMYKEKEAYTHVVHELRVAMDSEFGKGSKQLSAAVSASPAKLAAIDFDAVKDDFDFVNIMSYDMYGAFSRNPGHQTAVHAKPLIGAYFAEGADKNLKDDIGQEIVDAKGQKITGAEAMRGFSTEGAVNAILDNNPEFPSTKLVIGAASYSRGWHTVRVPAKLDKLFWHGIADGKSVSREGLGSHGTFENGVTDFREIYDNYIAKGKDFYYDKQAEAAYVWEPKSNDAHTVGAHVETLDSQRSVIAKGELMKKYNLGGLFAWASSTDNGLILNTMNAAVCNKKADGNYYSFSEHYNGEVNTAVVEKDAKGQATKVAETVSGPMTYRFDGQAYCLEKEEGQAELPIANAGKDIVKIKSDGWPGTMNLLDGGLSQHAVSYHWKILQSTVPMELRELGDDPAQTGQSLQGKSVFAQVASNFKNNKIPTTNQAVFELTVVNKDGKTATDYVKMTFIPATASIIGSRVITQGHTLNLTAESNVPNAISYQWQISHRGAKESLYIKKNKTPDFIYNTKALPVGEYDVDVFIQTKSGRDSVFAEKLEHLTIVKEAVKPDDEIKPDTKYPAYKEGTKYKGGDIVTGTDGKHYECRNDDGRHGWCGQAAGFYAPGTGSAWTEAWKLFTK